MPPEGEEVDGAVAAPTLSRKAGRGTGTNAFPLLTPGLCYAHDSVVRHWLSVRMDLAY